MSVTPSPERSSQHTQKTCSFYYAFAAAELFI